MKGLNWIEYSSTFAVGAYARNYRTDLCPIVYFNYSIMIEIPAMIGLV